MSSDQFITVREAAQLLGTSEKKIMDLVTGQQLQAYRIADQFLRLKKTEVVAMRSTGDIVSETIHYPYTTQERLRDFFYFNDFYLVALFIIAGLLFVIFRLN